MGTEIIRESMNKPNFHVGRVCEDIHIIEQDFDYIIIPDCRFTNEVYYTKAEFDDAIAVRINRPNHVSKLTEEQLNHPSEVDLDDFNFDMTISNEYTLEELRACAGSVAMMIRRGVM